MGDGRWGSGGCLETCAALLKNPSINNNFPSCLQETFFIGCERFMVKTTSFEIPGGNYAGSSAFYLLKTFKELQLEWHKIPWSHSRCSSLPSLNMGWMIVRSLNFFWSTRNLYCNLAFRTKHKDLCTFCLVQ